MRVLYEKLRLFQLHDPQQRKPDVADELGARVVEVSVEPIPYRISVGEQMFVNPLSKITQSF